MAVVPAATTSASTGVANEASSVAVAVAPKVEAKPRIATKRMLGWIYEKTDRESLHVGYLRAGATIARSAAPVKGVSCKGDWWAVEPAGFMCEGSDGVTTDLNDPTVVAAAKRPPEPAPLPYGYGTSFGAQMYARIPTPAEQAEVEGDIAGHAKNVAAMYAKMDPKKVPPATALPLAEIPDFLANHAGAPTIVEWPVGEKVLLAGYAWPNMRLSFLHAFESEGRAFYLTSEHFIIPADRVRAARLADFTGVKLAKPGEPGEHLPMMWVRWKPSKVYRLDGDEPVETEVVLPFQAHSSIAEKDVFRHGTRYFELLSTPAGLAGEAGAVRYLVRADGVTRIDRVSELPNILGPDERWIEVKIGHQVLTVYEGLVPTFITLVSTGVDGLDDPETSRATPRGVFRIHSKHVTYRMAADEHPPWKEGDKPDPKYRVDDVPWVQYFHGGYAIHGAYWHDAFGNPKSHGCINLSPRDAQFLFGLTLPQMPDAWHGVYGGRAGAALGTYLFVRGY
ncbi:MAG: L,D-transpeptidase [Polyangiales bacterium]